MCTVLFQFCPGRISPDKLLISPASEEAADCQQKDAPRHGHRSVIEAAAGALEPKFSERLRIASLSQYP